MSLASMLTEPYTILTRTAVTGTAGVDRYGNPQYTYATGGPVYGRSTQKSATETDVGGDELIIYRLLVLFPDVVLTAYDRVQDAAGVVWEVIGQPHVATTPRGPHHLEVSLRHVAV